MSNYQKVFDLYADSTNHTVKKSDLTNMLLFLGHTINANALSKINSEEITFDQFKQIALDSSKNDLTFEQLKEAFESYDTNQSGRVSFNNLLSIYSEYRGNLDEEEVSELMNAVMPDKDGFVNYLALMKDFFETKEENK